ncbi:MAG: hypothetical protein E5X94_00595 [Mesorhizobium sp.]|uniref:hypothetical protein n=1 Tax=unclassified Mesorhizobium TaxID=325217 RepID=UPI000FCB5C32|nr:MULTISPECIES: hypothetical protein [unclassified Mesorhizobium]RUW04051.1 hypothetical protein EOA49_00555 [Mesorhizobium sp. M1A.F.Ca.IN.020.04.1.1]RUW04114.1 hypothetical protein EOA49_00890 [Mesorhizobium sp. M1A.F.Ca.IN.020.04.1.1]TIN82750.1 MAG: hypothetical protein E5X97_29020 [Mesorhizobium sp.]TIN88337.1 MAG: hypothetical protein E5X94_00595 [Mesorhizobium sp.]
MGGSTQSTPQIGPSPMGAVTPGTNAPFHGYMQTPIAPISAPQYPGALSPSLAETQAATVARMLARTPVMAAPTAAPKKPVEERHGGSGNGRGGLGGAMAG